MEINEKKKKEQQELIIRKYQQYLKLEKSLSPNTLDAYLTDLDKLMSFLTLEGIYVSGRMPVRSSTFCGRIT